MSHSLDAYIKFVVDQNEPNESKYPALKGKSEEEKRDFMARHFLIHLAKFGGKIAADFEAVDHGGESKAELLKGDVAKQLIATLYMAKAVGLSEDDFAHILEIKYNDIIKE